MNEIKEWVQAAALIFGVILLLLGYFHLIAWAINIGLTWLALFATAAIFFLIVKICEGV